MKIFFIRHAETQTNIEGLTHKIDDPAPLTELGKKQAEKLVQVCKQENIEKIFSSPEYRAVETAEIIAKELNVELENLKEFAERDFGILQGKAWGEIEKVLLPMSVEERYNFVPLDGESWKQMEDRLKVGLDKIIKSDFANVAVITHGGVIRCLMPLLLNTPKETSFNYHFGNSSVTSFEYKNKVFTELKVNDTSHL